ncbi:MAG: RagB/SusD family nutrient uptake outer membrane protein [Candidatus Symbiothrix sp.]|jgi:hypothetical protein|nr:RagB/SusD family nutrient uptake outer membrane protein [Candidatus Symbiothrix sp.]
MKLTIKIIFFLAGCFSLLTACRDDLLNQPSTGELVATEFWKTTADAEYALNGLKSDARWLFNRDYFLDGMGEYLKVRGCAMSSNGAHLRGGIAYRGFYELQPSGYGSSFNNMFEYCYGGISRANYVVDGLEKMLPTLSNQQVIKDVEAMMGEAKLIRALIYFKLIAMWGDVPYIDWRVYSDAEVASLSRTPIATIYKHLIDDLEYAFQKLPEKASVSGNFAKPAALALRGKIHLFWASWNKFGWPELDTFTPDSQEAENAYQAAIEDFGHVIDDYGLTLFRNGEPGECDELGKAEKLPNYYYLFTPIANGDSEFVLAFNFGGQGTNQGEELMRDFAGRSIEYSQVWVCPRSEIADRYQSTITGDFCPPLVKMPAPDGRTVENAAVNPQSYANRDYRMKSSILWDYEMSVGLSAQKETGWVPYIYRSWAQQVVIDGKTYTSYETDGTSTGYVFRKFVRNYGGAGRSDGDFNWPIIRLADVYLMYAEADNALNGPKPKAIELVNRVRHRGNLPDLSAATTATPEAFFAAIEQERIVELLAEGHRSADLRRWRAIERVWKPAGNPDGVKLYDTYGTVDKTYFQNQSNLTYERCYIFQIPSSERNRNPNLTQNKPYR